MKIQSGLNTYRRIRAIILDCRDHITRPSLDMDFKPHFISYLLSILPRQRPRKHHPTTILILPEYNQDFQEVICGW